MMECNKEEAIHAKGVAEIKMQQKDFVGARKVILKAQRLFPDLENIVQMLTVCDVHCAEAIKVNNQEDWYGILQVEPTADDNSIKKQYRKLALLLHPDKNKFAGAEAAFKLVGEAHRILSDRAKRSFYDANRRSSVRIAAAMPPPHRASPSPFATAHSVPKQHPQQSRETGSETFWTSCPFCGIRYQYYRTTMSRAVRCQSCSKSFIAYDMNAGNVPRQAHSMYTTNQAGVPQGNGFSRMHTFKTTQASSNVNFQGNTAPGPWSRSRTNNEFGGPSGNTTNQENCSSVDPEKESEVKFEKVKLEKVSSKVQTAKSAGSTGRKRARKTVEDISEEEDNLSDSSDSDEEICDEMNRSSWSHVDMNSNRNPRRSTRQKQDVTYAEDQSDDDFVSLPRKSRNRRSPRTTVLSDDDEVKISTERSGGFKVDGSSNGSSQENAKSGPDEKEGEVEDAEGTAHITPDGEDFSYPDPEFHDFDKDRESKVFKAGQIWALYDDVDGMPRFYVRIYSILVPDFKIRFCWLEHVPLSPAEMDWSEAGLPIACGTFETGEKEITDNRAMFSHLISCEKDKRKNRFIVCPGNGQIWALYRAWDKTWSSTPGSHKCFDYDIVEILSVSEEGVDVAMLIKVRGFVSLFARGSHDSLHIACSDMLQFSHMIPSYRMSGKEADGVPEGSYELDPASLPPDFESKFPAVSLEHIKSSHSEKPGTTSKSRMQGVDISNGQSGKTHGHSGDKGACQIPNPEPSASSSSMEKPNFSGEEEKLNSSNNRGNKGIGSGSGSLSSSPVSNRCTEFHNFKLERSFSKIMKGQIWALHCNLDGYPKEYVYVRDVQERVSKVHVTRLEACQDSGWHGKCYDKKPPIACGRFKLSSGRGSREVFDTLATFSHVVQFEPCSTKNFYDIYPQIGQVWALYRNWSPEWVESDIKGCSEYDVVEVLSTSISVVVVMFLENKSPKSVFAPKDSSGKFTMEIPSIELSRFSHRIPSFRLTGETGGHPSGWWALDPASLPRIS